MDIYPIQTLSQYEDGSFIQFKYFVPIIENHVTVTLQKFTIFTMLIHIRFE